MPAHTEHRGPSRRFDSTTAPLPLDRETEADLARRARAGCRASLDRLARSNLGYVIRTAWEYRDRGVALEDLVAEGNVGLLEAARRFDPDRETKFITYASWWIRKALLRALHEQARLVVVPYYRVKKEGWIAARATEVSLETIVGGNPGVSLGDVLQDRDSPQPEAKLLAHERQALLRRALAALTPQEVGVLTRRFGLDGNRCLTLKEAGEELGVSRERIRQVESVAVAKLARALRREGPGARGARPQRRPATPA